MRSLFSKIAPSFLILALFICGGCTTSSKSSSESPKEEVEQLVELDSTQDAIFDMEVNGEMWHKNDSASAKFTAKPPFEILHLSASDTSFFYQNLAFTAVLGKEFNEEKFEADLIKYEGDTLYASVYYAFSEVDFTDSKMSVRNYLAFSMFNKLTAIIILTKIDTAKKQINGRFKGYVKDAWEETYKFRKGIFLNIPYHKTEVN